MYYRSLFYLCCALTISTTLFAQPPSIQDYLAADSIQAIPTEEGIYFQLEEEGEGPQPKPGDYVMVRYQGKLLDGTTFDESIPGEPFVFQMGYRQVIRGWDLGLSNFRVGSKGQLFIPPQLGYGSSEVGNVPANSPLVFDIELLRIMDYEAYDAYMIELEEKERMAFESQQAQQFKEDKRLIQEYALANKMKAKRTASGLSYVINKKGKGETAKPGDVLEVQYKGSLISGEVFDQTKGKKTFSLTFGEGTAINAVSYTHLTLPTICSVSIEVVAGSMKKNNQ